MAASSKLELTLDSYVTSAPSAQNMLDVFAGEWSSRFPPPFEKLRAGGIPLFQDPRIHWMMQQLGGVAGLRVLELGPLEGGHSYILDQAGASHVFAIEANRRAFLKCLMAKEILRMRNVEFSLGDFREFLSATKDRWDLCVASGVLYHMHEPMELLRTMAEHSDRLYLWTHYYEESAIHKDRNLKHRFDPKPIARQTGTLSYTLHRLNYLTGLKWKGFCGGSTPYSFWLTRPAILDALRHFGFVNLAIGHDTPDHLHGPCFSVLATR